MTAQLQEDISNQNLINRKFSVAPMMDWTRFYTFLFKFKKIAKANS